MRKISTKLIFILLVCSIVIPFFPVRAQPKPAKIPTYKIGAAGSAIGNWDGPVASAGFAGTYYASDTLESFFIAPENSI